MAEKHMSSQENRVRVCTYCSKNLRRFRKYLRMNQKEFATAIGTTQRHISEIENGKAKVSWTLMLALSAIFIINEKNKEDYSVMKEISNASMEENNELEKIIQDLRECGWMEELAAAFK